MNKKPKIGNQIVGAIIIAVLVYYLLKINDNKILNNFLENDFEKTVKVYGDYYYQNGFNVINLDSISSVE